MKIRTQQEINTLCENELSSIGWFHMSHTFKRLRRTSAFVCETDKHYILLSGGQYVALISKTDDVLFYVAEKTLWRNAKIDNQIDKFVQDYGRSDGGCHARFTWVAV